MVLEVVVTMLLIVAVVVAAASVVMAIRGASHKWVSILSLEK